jgi:aryl-alcohol dehydrogenase-like predicted oxidoreductase
MKLVLGSAQFGTPYGLFNKKKISLKNIQRIEKFILDKEINFIDTAFAYGDSEIIIGNSKLNKLNIITKIKIPENKKKDIKNFVQEEIFKSLSRLKVAHIYGLLVHDVTDLFGTRGKIFLSCLQNLKKKKIIKKIGVSIYSPNELKKIWKFWKPDIVQAPFNVFDQRILTSGWIDILKKFKIQIFVRSCFLQGLLICKKYNLLKIDQDLKFSLDQFNYWCRLNKISNLQASLNFVKQFKRIDFVVVGFNDYIQLKEIVNAFKKKNKKLPNNFRINNPTIIDPRKWNLKKIKF